MSEGYRICSRCIMDTSDPEITFDNEGICCHCRHYEHRAEHDLHNDDAGKTRLARFVEMAKEEGKGKEYDCVIGVSGGIDSSTVAYKVKKDFGLRPLAVHLDNGWDAELAVANIEKLLKTLEIDLYTYVLDWEEFRDLQVSFLKASIANAEIPTDHAIVALLYRLAIQHHVRFIISGGNVVTEAIMPSSWMYDATDWRLIRSVHKRFGKIKLRTFPKLDLFDWTYNTFVRKITFFPLLNYVDYNKKASLEVLKREMCWKDYGGKHFESIYTRFFQTYILPRKFGIDKRRAHLSTLINSRQMTRAEAQEEMENDYFPPDLLEHDREFVIKKLGLAESEFEAIMSAPPMSFTDYPNNNFWFEKLGVVVRHAKKRTTSIDD